MDVCLLCMCCVLSGKADHSSRRGPTDCGASLCVIKKPRGRGGHSPRWAAVPEKINNNCIHLVILRSTNYERNSYNLKRSVKIVGPVVINICSVV
jgi:hypothetical protein